ncbi:Glycosyltransferase family 25 (LPS biosynthesis protein) [Rhodobacteraceae bacterium THAF1]|uniref:glycosyltransferase family 25 protein n=1 Tax=Palleronia sp. THAF1 TaxID=2587842 RepID=UPI000F3CD38B|nr:glycosyltransferase family 25 protein [Palleronia sp. THAF1]QFU09891.1 Glycosyltransferase family 25 (LPS biosynthesis protein) [Palleronia sp. THAF1]VDC17206.1 Glycosyltransferase family 25 (LPS biosynthesis protein) [Rhodobacteraceae bacterium THAF1]
MSLEAFLINLDGSDARLATAASQLDRIGMKWSRVPAVDGRGKPTSDFPQYDDAACRRYMGRSMTGAEIACHLSHARAAETFLHSGASHGLILEDDFTLIADGPTLTTVCEWLMAESALDWQIANLGAHKNKISTEIASVEGHAILRAHYFPMLATAILWTRPAAKTFVADAARLFCPADNQLRYWQTRTDGGLSIWPPLIRAGDHPSDIDSKSRRTDKVERTATYGLAKQRRLWTDKIIAFRHQKGL